MFQQKKLQARVNGNVVATAEVADETFASEMLGTTVAVEPTDGKIVAPCDGEVMNIFDTGHAVCIATEAGAEILIHIGIDTGFHGWKRICKESSRRSKGS